MNKYDIEVYVDNQKVATIKNGTATTGSIDLMEGVHTISFYSAGNQKVGAKTTVNMVGDVSYACDLLSNKSDIEIRNAESRESAQEEVEFPWTYDALLATANSFVYNRVISLSMTAAEEMDCFTYFDLEDKTYYAVIKASENLLITELDIPNIVRVFGTQLNKTFANVGIKSQFVFVNDSGAILSCYDADGKQLTSSAAMWYTGFKPEYWWGS